MIVIPKRYYDSSIQVYAMQSLYPQFTYKQWGQYDIEFTGNLQVKPEYPVYTVSIKYLGNSRPQVRVLKPELIEYPKHFFQENKTICLYQHAQHPWSKEKLIATYIVRWTAGWIYFYETWLRTGEWYGPEAPH